MIYSEDTGESVHPEVIDFRARRTFRLDHIQVTVSCILKNRHYNSDLSSILFSTETIKMMIT